MFTLEEAIMLAIGAFCFALLIAGLTLHTIAAARKLRRLEDDADERARQVLDGHW